MTPLVEEIVPAPDSAGCCAALAGLPCRLFLDSASTGSRFGRYSFLTADPVAVVRSRGAETECRDLSGWPLTITHGDGLVAASLVAAHAAEPVPGLPPFQGGAAGYVAADWGLTLERLPAPRYDDLGLPRPRHRSTTGYSRGITSPHARGSFPPAFPRRRSLHGLRVRLHAPRL